MADDEWLRTFVPRRILEQVHGEGGGALPNQPSDAGHRSAGFLEIPDGRAAMSRASSRSSMPQQGPMPRHFVQTDAAVMVCDISGFSRLCDDCEAEQASATLEAVLHRVHTIVESEFSGVVAKLLGDGVLAVFPYHATAAERCAAAAACALRLCASPSKVARPSIGHRERRRSTAFSINKTAAAAMAAAAAAAAASTPAQSGAPTSPTPVGGRSLAELPGVEGDLTSEVHMHIGIGTGVVTEVWLGGEDNRWEYVLGGQPVVEAALALSVTRSQDVAVSTAVWAALEQDNHKQWSSVEVDGSTYLLTGGPSSMRPVSPSRLPALPDPSPDVLAVIRQFVPRVVIDFANESDESRTWLAEIRKITVLFVLLADSSLDDLVAVTALQETIAASQRAIQRCNGVLRQIAQDDKGLVLLAMFGLPPLSVQDAPSSAVRAALELRTILSQHAYSVGINTGSAYCGTMGDSVRREYGVVGSTVNTAARLATSCRNDIICGKETAKAIQGLFHAEPIPSIMSKDGQTEIECFRPDHMTLPQLQTSTRLDGPTDMAGFGATTLVGRAKETTTIKTVVGGVLDGRRRQDAAVVTGPVGMGKTALVRHSLHSLVAAHGPDAFVELWLSSSSVYKKVPNWPFGRLLQQILMLETANRADFTTMVTSKLGNNKEWRTMAPLLNPVLGTRIPKNDLTRALPGQARLDKTHQLIRELLLDYIDSRPLVLVVDDGQSLDSASWKLVLSLCDPDLFPARFALLVTTSNGELEPLTLLAEHHSTLVKLEPLSTSELFEITQSEFRPLLRQGVVGQAQFDKIYDTIVMRSKGNPLFCQQFVRAIVGKVDSEASMTASELLVALTSDIDELPDQLTDVIAAQLNALSTHELLVLKVASVIGPVFEIAVVVLIFPSETVSEVEITQHLGVLCRHGLVVAQDGEKYEFAPHVQDVAHSLLLEDQRIRLHSKLADSILERCTKVDAQMDLYASAAAHLTEAERPREAATYWTITAACALDQDAIKEAEDFARAALDLGAADVPREHLAVAESIVGHARVYAGRNEDALAPLLNAARGLGVVKPERLRVRVAKYASIFSHAVLLYRHLRKAITESQENPTAMFVSFRSSTVLSATGSASPKGSPRQSIKSDPTATLQTDLWRFKTAHILGRALAASGRARDALLMVLITHHITRTAHHVPAHAKTVAAITAAFELQSLDYPIPAARLESMAMDALHYVKSEAAYVYVRAMQSVMEFTRGDLERIQLSREPDLTKSFFVGHRVALEMQCMVAAYTFWCEGRQARAAKVFERARQHFVEVADTRLAHTFAVKLYQIMLLQGKLHEAKSLRDAISSDLSRHVDLVVDPCTAYIAASATAHHEWLTMQGVSAVESLYEAVHGKIPVDWSLLAAHSTNLTICLLAMQHGGSPKYVKQMLRDIYKAVMAALVAYAKRFPLARSIVPLFRAWYQSLSHASPTRVVADLERVAEETEHLQLSFFRCLAGYCATITCPQAIPSHKAIREAVQALATMREGNLESTLTMRELPKIS